MLNLKFNSLGAQLLKTVQLDKHPWLYLSPQPSSSGRPVRGGVPVLFPQFANLGQLSKHGFARNVVWNEVSTWNDGQQAGALFLLDVATDSVAGWPYAAKLELEVCMHLSEIRFSFRVTNTGTEPMSWTGGLHPYWWVPQLQHSKLIGLHTAPLHELFFDESGIEQLHPNHGELELDLCSHKIYLRAEGFTEWMVWNPGLVGAELLHDLPPDDWQHFVCIEPVCVSQPVVLAPAAAFVGTLTALQMPN